MAKLYPPYIEGTIPAFHRDNNGKDTLVVPFSMNKAVTEGEIAGFSLKVKSIQNLFIGTLTVGRYDINDTLTATFDATSLGMKIGQSYKLQLAYIGYDGQVGYYSTVGVVKYTSKPRVTIAELDSGRINGSQRDYIGHFNVQWDEDDTTYDPTEKEYSYKFTIYETDSDDVFEESDTLIHNSTTNEAKESWDIWKSSKDLVQNKNYYIVYTVTTINGMVVESPNYRLMDRTSIDADTAISIISTLNRENGYIDIQLIGELSSSGTEEPTSGKFVISRKKLRAADKWETVYNFVLQTELPSGIHWKDFTIEQGETYLYAIQQYNDAGLYSNKIYSNPIYADFEDAFLFDGERQLKIKYNPKVSSFKNDILESKMDTLGSQFPFIFRNGNVNYKEINIGGLISYWSDDEELFMPLEDLGLDDIDDLSRFTTIGENSVVVNKVEYRLDMNFDRIDTEAAYNVIDALQSKIDSETATKAETQLYDSLKTFVNEENNTHIVAIPQESGAYSDVSVLNKYRNYRKQVVEDLLNKHIKTTSLESYNYTAERIFKLNVLEWLTNGKPKLFKSPSEGNYIVRLMNTSLTPNDTINRLLHSFTTTAYEIAEYNYNNLNEYGLIHIEEPSNKKLRFHTIDLYDLKDSKTGEDLYKYYQYFSGENKEKYTPVIHSNNFSYYWDDEEDFLALSAEQQAELRAAGKVMHFSSNYYYILNPLYKDAEISQYQEFEVSDPNEYDKFIIAQELIRIKTQVYYIKTANFINLLPNGRVAQFIQLSNMTPGDIIEINDDSIYIGTTGAYNLNGLFPIKSIRIHPNFDMHGGVIRMQGQMTYGYYSEYQNVFNLINNIEIEDHISHQFIGENWDTVNGEIVNKNTITSIQDCKKEAEYYYNVRFEKRPIEPLYLKTTEFFKIAIPQPTSKREIIEGEYYLLKDGAYVRATEYSSEELYYVPFHIEAPMDVRDLEGYLYRDYTLKELIDIDDLQEWPMYKIYMPPSHEEIPEESKIIHDREYYYLDKQHDKFCEFKNAYIAYNSALSKNSASKIFEIIEEKNYSAKFYYNLNMDGPLKDYDPDFKSLNGSTKYACVDLEDKTEVFDFDKIQKIHDIYIMSGVMMLISYQICNKVYNLELTNQDVLDAKNSWLELHQYWTNLREYVDDEELGITDDSEFGEKFYKLNDEVISQKEFFVEYRRRYDIFIKVLEKAIEEYKEEMALNE